MVTSLSALISLEWLTIGFSRTPLPEQGARSLPAIASTWTTLWPGSTLPYSTISARRSSSSSTLSISPSPYSAQEAMIHSKGSTIFVTLYQLGAASGDGNHQQFRLGVSCEGLKLLARLGRLASLVFGAVVYSVPAPLSLQAFERLHVDAYFIWHGPRDEMSPSFGRTFYIRSRLWRTLRV
ncbi:hypothetical protein BJY52DRAFT_409915 [Lactarius psammicola]|nr:hypothetical protein BJY52DRAFT_409915 [Lactarius psammicola]